MSDMKFGRDEMSILHQAGTHHLTFSEALPGVEDADSLLKRLTDSGALKAEVEGQRLTFTADGKHPYYILGPKALEFVKYSKDRLKPPGEKALFVNAATLLYCKCGGPTRYRVDAKDLKGLFGTATTPARNVPYVLTDEFGGCALLRVYVTEDNVGQTIKQLRKYVNSALSDSTLRPWVETGQFGFVVLAHDTTKRDHIRQELKRPYKQYPALATKARVVCELAPSPKYPDNFRRFLQSVSPI